MTYLKLVDIKGLGSMYFEKLASVGIKSTQSFFDKCTTPQGRNKLSEESRIPLRLILIWVKKIDLLRIEGIGVEFWRLLENSKIGSVDELASQRPNILFQLVEKINYERNIVKRNPSLWEVENWISQAKNLPRVLQYVGANQSLSSNELTGLNHKDSSEDHLIYYLQRLKQRIPSQKLNQNLSNSFSGQDMRIISEKISYNS